MSLLFSYPRLIKRFIGNSGYANAMQMEALWLSLMGSGIYKKDRERTEPLPVPVP